MQLPDSTPSDGARFWRWISGLGIVFAILYTLGSIVLDGNAPDASAGGPALVRYFAGREIETTAAVFLIGGAVVAFAFFLTALRRGLAGPRAGQGHLSLVVTIGGAIFGAGMLLGGVLDLGLADAAGAHQTGVALTLGTLQGDDWLPVVTGLAVLGIGTGVAGLRSRSLPLWVTIPSLVFGVMALAGPVGAIAFLATPLWAILITAGLLVRSRSPRPAMAPGPLAEGV